MNMHHAFPFEYYFLNRGIRFASSCAVTFLAMVSIALAQPGSGMTGARNSALGNATSTEWQDATSLLSNPATMAYITHALMVVDYQRGAHGATTLQAVMATVPVTVGSAVGVGMSSYQSVPLGDEGSPIRGRRYAIDAGSAHMVSTTMSLGFAAKFSLQETHGGVTVWANSLSAGVAYTPSPEVTYAAVYRGIGFGIKHTYDPDVPQGHSVTREALPGRLHVGLAMRYPSSSKGRILTLSLANEKEFGSEGLSYLGGLEYLVTSGTALRFGYVVTPTTSAPRYGLGIKVGSAGIDYAYSPSMRIGQFHEVTVGIRLTDGSPVY